MCIRIYIYIYIYTYTYIYIYTYPDVLLCPFNFQHPLKSKQLQQGPDDMLASKPAFCLA